MTIRSKIAVLLALIISIFCSSFFVACNDNTGSDNPKDNDPIGAPMFSVIGDGSISYHEPSDGVTGILVNLKEGDILRYNDVIDLNNFDRGMPFIKFCTMPEITGIAEAHRLKVRLTDALDDNNYLEIDIKKCNNGTKWDNVVSYCSVSFNDGPSVGLQRDNNGPYQIINSRDNLPHNYKAYIDNKYGTNMMFSMVGMSHSGGVAHSNQGGEVTFGFMFDTAAQQLFLTLCTEEDDTFYDELCTDLTMRQLYEKPFYGFTDGRVKIEIIPEEMVKSTFRLFVSEVAFVDIDENNYNSFDTSVVPNIYIDMTSFSDNLIPPASIGVPYEIFKAKASDVFSDNIDVAVKVYFEEDGSEIEIADGKFIPTKLGNYVIEYMAINEFGNKTVNKINVNVLN